MTQRILFNVSFHGIQTSLKTIQEINDLLSNIIITRKNVSRFFWKIQWQKDLRDLLLVQRWFQRGFARSSTALPGGLRNSRLVQIIRGRYVEHVAGAPKYLSGALARITRNHRETIWLTLPCWRSLRHSVSVATRKKSVKTCTRHFVYTKQLSVWYAISYYSFFC